MLKKTAPHDLLSKISTFEQYHINQLEIHLSYT